MRDDSVQNHPDTCTCDDCGYELHPAHVTIPVLNAALKAKIKQAQQENKQRRQQGQSKGANEQKKEQEERN